MRTLDDDLILFSMQDLFGYLRAHATMSGIQRVQAGIAIHAIDTEGEHIGFILNDLTDRHQEGEFLLIDNAAFRDVIVYASGSRVDHDRLRMMLDDVETSAERIRPSARNTIILLGAFWGHGNTMDRYVPAKRDGARIGAYVYDIIPITHPEYCDAALVRDFAMSVGELGLVVDFIFTISDYTRETLAALFRENGGREIPMMTVPLAHSLTQSSEGSSWPTALRRLKDRPYVAYVSTLEGRKNHLYVVNAWQQMIAEGVDVPDLVFVGRRGWRVSGLMDLLDGTHYLDGRVHLVHDLSDAELNAVYAGCQFTVFTSFVEGWGLPVGESLVHHVPCAASRASSIPEVGGDFVDYLDPLNLRQGVEVLRRMIEDKDYLASRRRAIAEDFVPRSWDDVGADFLAKTRAAMALEYPERLIYPALREGVKFEPGRLATGTISMRDYVPSPMRVMMTTSFFALEPHGSWMRGSVGELNFLTDLAPGTAVIAYLEVHVPASGAALEVAVQIVGQGPSAPLRWQHLESGRRNLVRTRGLVGADGLCTVVIQLGGELERREHDSRLFGAGLTAIGYVREDHHALREDLVERFTFTDLTAN